MVDLFLETDAAVAVDNASTRGLGIDITRRNTSWHTAPTIGSFVELRKEQSADGRAGIMLVSANDHMPLGWLRSGTESDLITHLMQTLHVHALGAFIYGAESVDINGKGKCTIGTLEWFVNERVSDSADGIYDVSSL